MIGRVESESYQSEVSDMSVFIVGVRNTDQNVKKDVPVAGKPSVTKLTQSN